MSPSACAAQRKSAGILAEELGHAEAVLRRKDGKVARGEREILRRLTNGMKYLATPEKQSRCTRRKTASVTPSSGAR